MRAKQSTGKGHRGVHCRLPIKRSEDSAKDKTDDQTSGAGRRRGNQISDTGVHSTRQSDLLCRLQETYWTLSGAEGSGEVQEGVVRL
jgi:hypothetical protein